MHATDMRELHARDCLQTMQAEIAADARKAHQENIGIYMQPVPRPEALPRIDGKQMVSAKSPEAELLKRDEEWFGDIVPDKVTRNLSRCATRSWPKLPWRRRLSCARKACVRVGKCMISRTGPFGRLL